jgi:hypothetical protein
MWLRTSTGWVNQDVVSQFLVADVGGTWSVSVRIGASTVQVNLADTHASEAAALAAVEALLDQTEV